MSKEICIQIYLDLQTIVLLFSLFQINVVLVD